MATTQKARNEYIKKIPYLKPGTYSALRILRKLQGIIRAEPKRLLMASWMEYYAGKMTDSTREVKTLPACGTVACAAGWINLITGHRVVNKWLDGVSPGHKALQHIGLGKQKREIQNLYYGDMASSVIKYKSPEHEAAGLALEALFGKTSLGPASVIKRIDRIIEKHRKVLSEATITIKE